MRGARWILMICAVVFGGAFPVSGQSLTGMIADGSSDAPVPGALVQLLTPEMDSVASVRTGPLGTFSLSAPGPGHYLVSIAADGYLARLSDLLAVEAERSYELVLTLTPVAEIERRPVATRTDTSADPGTADIVGRVVEHETGEPLSDVEITMEGLQRTVASGSSGYFSLEGLPQGVHEIRFSRLGFAEQSALIFLEPGNGYRVEATLTEEAIPIEGVTVTIEDRELTGFLADVQHRLENRGLFGGIFFTREDLEFRGNSRLSRVLDAVGGLKMEKRGNEYMVELRRGQFMRCGGLPLLYIDGQIVSRRNAPGMPLDMIPGMDIEVVEVYKSAATIPPEFAGSDAQCGAIVVWTRRGR